jgi:Carbohydrate esterase, sialic acid-specific acetylesterase
MRRSQWAAVSGIAATLALITPTSTGATTQQLATPSGVTVTPQIGGVRISWNVDAQAGITYSVSSRPTGMNCHAVDGSSCVVEDRTSTHYSFFVTAAKQGFRSSAPSALTAPITPHLVLVVAGQSNATGWLSYATDPNTGTNYMAPPYTNGADSHDLITWAPWLVLQGNGAAPVPLDSPQQANHGNGSFPIVFGPEISLARQLWDATGRSLTIVKTAYPSTSLAFNWSPSGRGPLPGGLFSAMVSKVKTVMAQDASAGQFDVLGGFYWYQGEGDAEEPAYAKAYEANLKQFIAAVRSDLPLSSGAPVVLAKEDTTAYNNHLLSTGAITPAQDAARTTWNTEVRNADNWAATNLAHVVEVDTAGLARVSPLFIHLSNVSELTVGHRMASVSEGLLP